MPAVNAYHGDHGGATVLDAGCGAGQYAAALLDRGARAGFGYRLVDALVARGATGIGDRVAEHHAAGADEVVLTELPGRSSVSPV